MESSSTTQWILAVLWLLLLVVALSALATDSNSLFLLTVWMAITLGIGTAVLQLRRRRTEQH